MIGHALALSDGYYDPNSLWWIAAAMALAWTGFLSSGRWRLDSRLVAAVCAAAVIWDFIQLYTGPAPVLVRLPLAYYALVLPLMALAACGAIALAGPLRNACAGALVVLFLANSLWLLRRSPLPHIDVFEVTQDACVAMTHGQSPYAIDFPDIYTARPDWEVKFYPPGSVYGGRVHFGYQYMPLSMLAAFVGHAVGGDFRLASAAAVAGAAALLLAISRAAGAVAACLLIMMPREHFILEHGWTEPIVVVCLAAVVFCAVRWKAALPYAAGLLIASKQHMFLCAPAMLLLIPRPWAWHKSVTFFAKAAATALAVTLPLVLWDVRAFWHSAVVELSRNPFRDDSLNFAAAWVRSGHAPPPEILPFALGAAAACVAAWSGRLQAPSSASRRAAQFAGAVAVIYLSFFALSKQTFCNYYFLVVGALCCAIAAEGSQTGQA